MTTSKMTLKERILQAYNSAQDETDHGTPFFRIDEFVDAVEKEIATEIQQRDELLGAGPWSGLDLARAQRTMRATIAKAKGEK